MSCASEGMIGQEIILGYSRHLKFFYFIGKIAEHCRVAGPTVVESFLWFKGRICSTNGLTSILFWQCNKKHTFVCPEYTLTGSCSSSTCKLRHPKNTKQTIPASKDSVDSEKEAQKGSKRELQKGRYFTLTAPAEEDHPGQPVSTANAILDKVAESGDDLVDFISIDEYDSESSKEYQNTGTL